MSDLDRMRDEVAALLDSLPNTPLGTRLFNAIARKSFTIAFEAVMLRERGGQLEVYLTKRGPEEAYPSQWHCPGTCFRPGEIPETAGKRLAAREFQGAFTSICYVNDFFSNEDRGPFLSKVYLVKLDREPEENDRAGWFSVSRLPEEMVSHHVSDVIPIGLKAYQP